MIFHDEKIKCNDNRKKLECPNCHKDRVACIDIEVTAWCNYCLPRNTRYTKTLTISNDGSFMALFPPDSQHLH